MKLTQCLVDKWLEAAWRDGFAKGVDGHDELPDFTDLCPQVEKDTISLEEKENAPFDESKCHARILKDGYGVQCTRSSLDNECVCRTHLKPILPFGRFNEERPLRSLDKDQLIAWHDTKKSKKSKKSKSSSVPSLKQPKMKIGEIRDYLGTRIANSKFKGLKKSELMQLYLEEKEKENISSSDSDTESPFDVLGGDIQDENLPSPIPADFEPEPEPEPEQEEILEVEPEPELEPEPEPEPEPEQEEILEVVTQPELEKSGDKPRSVSDYKKRFAELDIDTDGLKGLRAFKQRYEEYLKELEEQTEAFSDEDDDLEEDTSNYVATTFEGVSYLEDEDTGDLYNMKHECVGKWNEDVDDIIWKTDSFHDTHDNARD